MSHRTGDSLAVGYLRRSTDQQDRSLDAQRLAIEVFAAANTLNLIDFYVDDAISGTRSHGRNAFQQMILDAGLPERRFTCVLVYDVKRFGRMDNDETGYYRFILRKHGVRVQYVSEGFSGNSIDDLIRPVKQWQARQESKDLAKVVIRGYHSKFASRGGGWWISGAPPYGYDRQYEDTAGQFLFVARHLHDGRKQLLNQDGSIIRVLGAKERLMLSDQDRCRLVPSTPERVLTIQRIFYECTHNGIGGEGIAKRLTLDGIRRPRCDQGPLEKARRWCLSTVRCILSNPAYVGDSVWNRSTVGSFYSVTRTGMVERPEEESRRQRANPPEQWMTSVDAHPPLVTRAVFQQASSIISVRGAAYGRLRSTERDDISEYRAQYVLVGILNCATCGRPLYGRAFYRHYACRSVKHYRARVYQCLGTLRPWRRGCALSAIRKRVLERVVIQAIEAWYKRYLESTAAIAIPAFAIEQGRRWCKSMSDADLEEATRSLSEAAMEFMRQLPVTLKSPVIGYKRTVIRRCVDRIRVNTVKGKVVIWVRRFPVLGATVGGTVRLTVDLPKLGQNYVLGPSKRRVREGRAEGWPHGRYPQAIRDLVDAAAKDITALGEDVRQSCQRAYMAFSVKRHFVCLRVTHFCIRLYLKLDAKRVRGRPTFFRDVTGLGTQATGDVELSIRSLEDLYASRPLIRAAYNKAHLGQCPR